MDDLLRDAKERFLLEGQKAYIAINAAGAAALLAFLQAIWDKPTAIPLRAWVLYGIISFAVGVAVATASYPIRHYALTQKALTSEHWLFRIAYWIIPLCAILAFLAGLGFPVVGAFSENLAGCE